MTRSCGVSLLLVLGCGRSAPPHAIADPVVDAHVRVSSDAGLSLPLVSGCGCAYQCAHALRQGTDGIWEVTHDFLDSTTVRAVIERRCFDDKGHAYPEVGAPKEATLCRQVFYDRTPCGGECIPTTTFVRCGG